MSDRDRTPPFPFVIDFTFQDGDVVFATDKRGRLVYWNRESERLFGYAASEVLGNPYDVICLAAPHGPEIDLAAILAGSDFAGGMRCFDKSQRELELYIYATAGRSQVGAPDGIVFIARDVSEFWHAEQALRGAEDRYRLLFENSTDSVAVAAIDGRVLEVNPTCLRMYGYTAEEVRKMNLADVVALEYREAAVEAMADLAAGRRVTKTIKVLRKDGTRFDVDLVATVFMVGGERRVLSVTRDVTERAEAEAVLRESEERYRTIFASVGDAVFLETLDGSILEVNDNACQLLGYTRGELLALKVSDLVPPDARAWLPHVTDAVLRDRTLRAEAVNLHKSGRHIPVEISISAMELEDRTLALAIVRDISDRKQAEVALAESENRYRTLFNNSLMGIYRTTREGKILLANPALVRMLGYESFAQLAERNLEKDGSGPEYKRDEFKRRLESVGRIVGLEARWQTRDGRALFVRESAQAVRGKDGEVLYYEGTVEDISERKAAEQALRESEGNFRALAENFIDGVAVADSTGRYVYVNSRLAEITGYPIERLLEMSFRDLLRPDDARALGERYEARMRGEAVPSRYELMAVRADGELVPVEVSVTRTVWRGQTASFTNLRDIRERRVAEQVLRREKELAQTYLAVAGVIMVVLDETGAVRLLNRKGCEVLGCTEAEGVGRNWFDSFVPERHRAEVGRVFRSLMRGELEPVDHYENPVVTLNGEERQIAWYNTLLRDEAVRIVGTLSSGEDVTERNELVLAAAAAAAQTQAILANSPDGIAAECDGLIAYANQRFAELFGYDNPAQVTGLTAADFVAPEDHERVVEYSRARARGDQAPARYRFKGLRRDSALVELEITVSSYRLLDKQYLLGFVREAAAGPRRRFSR